MHICYSRTGYGERGEEERERPCDLLFLLKGLIVCSWLRGDTCHRSRSHLLVSGLRPGFLSCFTGFDGYVIRKYESDLARLRFAEPGH